MSGLPRRRAVVDVMTVRVHVASPQTPFKVLVRLIEENRISAVPIVDQAGRPVGVVSESDLLLKERLTELVATASPLRMWRERVDRQKAAGVTAADLMTSPAITVRGDARIADAARLMHQRKLRRLVVVDDAGRIAGIVSRSDLLQVFMRSDEEIREELVLDIIPAILLDAGDSVQVGVSDNVVNLSGEVDRRSDVEIAERVAREVEGVVDVVNALTYRWDDISDSSRGAPAMSGPLAASLGG